jgi:hypothetical protein
MNKITMDKKYQTRNGHPARVLCIDLKNSHYSVVAAIDVYGDEETVRYYTSTGASMTTMEKTSLDLIEVQPYADFEVDDPVMVKDKHDKTWCRRHFAGVGEEGKATTFRSGNTSWTAGLANTMPWDQCRRPTEEELACAASF